MTPTGMPDGRAGPPTLPAPLARATVKTKEAKPTTPVTMTKKPTTLSRFPHIRPMADN
jgi:hypothetical protein